MFSRFRSSSKNDIRGVFRNLFTNHDNRSNNSTSLPRPEAEKKTLSRKLKSRLSSFKLSKKSRQLSNESLNILRTYNQISSPKNDELNVTSLSGILKTSKSSKSFLKKKLRFQDEVYNSNVKPEDLPEISQNSESSPKIMSDEDIAYYTKLKEEIIQKSNDANQKSPLKRKLSTNENIQGNPEKYKKLDESLYYYPPIDASVKEFHSNSNHENVMTKEGICTYVWTQSVINLSSSPHIDSASVKCIEEPSLCDNGLCKDSDSDLQFNMDISAYCSENFSSESCSVNPYRGKMPFTKKNSQHRFNPLSKVESCSVALLSQENNVNKMSWCSV